MRWIQDSFILLILFLISFFVFYASYLFRVLFLAVLVFYMFLFYLRGMIFIKYLVILVYIRGVVIFILYISCICWYSRERFRKGFILFMIVVIYFYDGGLMRKFSDVGEWMWMYLFFRFLFNRLVVGYSLNLFKVSGSLRF
jgi:hypothetical protein